MVVVLSAAKSIHPSSWWQRLAAAMANDAANSTKTSPSVKAASDDDESSRPVISAIAVTCDGHHARAALAAIAVAAAYPTMRLAANADDPTLNQTENAATDGVASSCQHRRAANAVTDVATCRRQAGNAATDDASHHRRRRRPSATCHCRASAAVICVYANDCDWSACARIYCDNCPVHCPNWPNGPTYCGRHQPLCRPQCTSA